MLRKKTFVSFHRQNGGITEMKKLSIDRIGKRGSIVLLIAGILCLAFGIYLQIRTNDLPFNAVEVTAEITAFENAEQSMVQTTSTLVTYTLNGKEYKNIHLGQFEGSWKVGDKITVCCRSDEPEKIWTRTMQYRGIFYIMFSLSFLLVSIYKLLNFRKNKNRIESDVDDSGEDKFKISSIIIPLAAGIPLTVNGILYWIMEHSILGMIIVVLGGAAILTGIFSLIDYISARRIKRSQSEKRRKKTLKHKKESSPEINEQ